MGKVLVIAEHLDAAEIAPEVIAALLGCYGVEMAPGRLVDAHDAVVAADAIGYPVAVKAAYGGGGRGQP